MLARSLVAVLLSIPATVAILGVIIVVTPSNNTLSMSALLLSFPLWIVIASASYLTPRASVAALILTGISLLGLGIVTAMKAAGLAGL